VKSLRRWLIDPRQRFDPGLAYKIYQGTFGAFADKIAARNAEGQARRRQIATEFVRLKGDEAKGMRLCLNLAQLLREVVPSLRRVTIAVQHVQV
jgi:hypothetical protein